MKITNNLFAHGALLLSLCACNFKNNNSSDDPLVSKHPLLASKEQAQLISELQPVEFDEPKLVFDDSGNGLMVWISKEFMLSKRKLYYSFYDVNSNSWSIDDYFETEQRPSDLSLMALNDDFVLVQHASDTYIDVFNTSSKQWQHLQSIKRRIRIVNYEFVASGAVPIDHSIVGIVNSCADCHLLSGEVLRPLPAPPTSAPAPAPASGSGGGGGNSAIDGAIYFGSDNRSQQTQTPNNLRHHLIKVNDGFAVLFQQRLIEIDELSTTRENILALSVFEKKNSGDYGLSKTVELDKLALGLYSTSTFNANVSLVSNSKFASANWLQLIDGKVVIRSSLINLDNFEHSESEFEIDSSVVPNVQFSAAMNNMGLALVIFQDKPDERSLDLSMCRIVDGSCHWTAEFSLSGSDLSSSQSQFIQLFNLDDGFLLATESNVMNWRHFAFEENEWLMSETIIGADDDGINYKTLFNQNDSVYVDISCSQKRVSVVLGNESNCNDSVLLKYQLNGTGESYLGSVPIPNLSLNKYAISINDQGVKFIAENAMADSDELTMVVRQSEELAAATESSEKLVTELNSSASFDPMIINISGADFLVVWTQFVNGEYRKHFRPYVDGVWGELIHVQNYDVKYRILSNDELHFFVRESSSVLHFYFKKGSGFSEIKEVPISGNSISRFLPLSHENDLRLIYVQFAQSGYELGSLSWNTNGWSEPSIVSQIAGLRVDLFGEQHNEKVAIAYVTKNDDKYVLESRLAVLNELGELIWSNPVEIFQSPYLIYNIEFYRNERLAFSYSFYAGSDDALVRQKGIHYFDPKTKSWSQNIISSNDILMDWDRYISPLENRIDVYYRKNRSLIRRQYHYADSLWSKEEVFSALLDYSGDLKFQANGEFLNVFWKAGVSQSNKKEIVKFAQYKGLTLVADFDLSDIAAGDLSNFNFDASINSNGDVNLIYTGLFESDGERNRYVPRIFAIPEIEIPKQVQ